VSGARSSPTSRGKPEQKDLFVDHPGELPLRKLGVEVKEVVITL